VIIDSSIVAAICLGEPDAYTYADILEFAESPKMSAATYVEAGAVLDSRRPGGLDTFIHGLQVEIVAVDFAQAVRARAAYHKFGKGSGHRAALNFGDCFSYALAMEHRDVLLYKGTDFDHTDVQSATD
jgi:ribonuclease VapC